MTTYRVVRAHAGACTHAILQLEFVHVCLSLCLRVVRVYRVGERGYGQSSKRAGTAEALAHAQAKAHGPTVRQCCCSRPQFTGFGSCGGDPLGSACTRQLGSSLDLSHAFFGLGPQVRVLTSPPRPPSLIEKPPRSFPLTKSRLPRRTNTRAEGSEQSST